MSDKRHPLSILLAQLVGKSNTVVIHTHIIKLLDNDHLSALFFEQLVYWSERTDNPEKWIAKTDADWFEELYLGKKQLIRIRSVLISFDLIETEVKRSKFYSGQPVLHYRVNLEGLESLLTGISRSAKRELPIGVPKGNSYRSAETDVSFTETLSETLQIELPVDADASTATPCTSKAKSKMTDERRQQLHAEGEALAQRIEKHPPVTLDDFTGSLGNEPLDTAAQRADDLRNAISNVFGFKHAAVVTNYAKMLSGKRGKGEYETYRMDIPVTATELQDWALWYKRAYPLLSLASKPESFAKSIDAFRDQLENRTAVRNPELELAPESPTTTAADRAAIREAIAARRAGGKP